MPCDPRWILVVSVLGSSLALLDSTFVNVALPVMQRELAVSAIQAQWIVEAYLLLLSSLVLVGGALGDRFGRRLVFCAGVVVFAIASAACGGAPDVALLVLARGVQGVGAALMVPGSLALIGAAYPDRKQRDAAIGTWSAASAVVSASGPVVGGWVVTHASWRWLFLVNIPIAATILAIAARRVTETRNESTTGRVDVHGATFATVGLGLVVYSLLEMGRPGPTVSQSLPFLGAGLALLAAFIVTEIRSPAPLLPLSLFRVRTFAGANSITLLVYGALGAGLFFLPFNLIQVQGYTPPAAGAALLPFVVLVSALSPAVGALSGRRGARGPLVLGSFTNAAGFSLLALPTVGGSYLTTFFPGIVVLGAGMGLIVAPLTAAVMGALEQRYVGIASGINNAVARAAGLLAIAGFGVLVALRFDAALDERLAPLSLPSAITRSLENARGALAATEPPPFAAPALRAPIRRAIADAYVAAFRSLMLACAGLSALGGLTAFVTIPPAPDSKR